MAKIVIEIPERMYKTICGLDECECNPLESYIQNGTPLEEVFKDVKAEIEKQYNWLQSTKRALYDVDIAFDAIKKSIDKHI